MKIGARKAILPWTPKTLFKKNGFTPGQWLDFTDQNSVFSDAIGNTPITNGGTIARVNDKSGNGYHMNIVNGTPIWSSGGYATFNGTDAALRVNSKLGYDPATMEFSFFVLGKLNPGTTKLLYGMGNSSDNNPVCYVMGSTGTATTLECWIRNDAGGAVYLDNTSAIQTSFFDNTKKVLGTLDFSTKVHGHVGETIGTSFSGTKSGTWTLNHTTLGCLHRSDASGYVNFFAGDVYQLVFLGRRMTAQEIIQLNAYWARF